MNQDTHPKRHRWRTRAIVTSVAIMVAIGSIVATQGWWLRALTLPQIQRLTGLHAEVSAIRLTWSGGLRAYSLSLSHMPPDQNKPILTAPEIQATIRWRSLLRAKLELREIVITRPVIRVAVPDQQASSQGATILSAWSANTSVGALPDVHIDAGVFHFVKTTLDQPQRVITLTVNGALRRRASDSTLSDITIELSSNTYQVSLLGWVNPSRHTATLLARDVDLPRWINSLTFERDQEQWRSLCTAGRLDSATVTYSPDHGFVSRLKVEGVQLTLPALKGDGKTSTPYTIENVSGVVDIHNGAVEAQLTGLIDGLPTRVKLTAAGLTRTTPFQLDLSGGPFLFDQEWAPITLAPDFVQTLLDKLSSPSAEIEGRVTLKRDSTSSSFDEGISITGEAKITNGSASFLKFPYPLSEIAGVVRFDDSTIRIEQLTGVGPSGARVWAEGTVTPSPNGVGLDLAIHSENTPIDEYLLRAIGVKSRKIVEDIFDRSLFNRLNDEGVFITSAQLESAQRSADRLETELKNAVEDGLVDRAARIRAQLAELNARRQAPEFDLAGLAQVDATVVRQPGDGSITYVEMDVRFDRAGIVHQSFPYPVWIEPLVVHLNLEQFEVISAPVTALTGATGNVSGAIMYRPKNDPPQLRIELEQMPVDEILLSALALTPGGASTQDTFRQSNLSAFVDSLRQLRPAGKVRGSAVISHTTEGTQYSVTVPFEGLRLLPKGRLDQIPLVIDDFTGELSISHKGIRIEDAVALVGASPVHFSMYAPKGNTSPIDINLQSDSFRIEEPIEQLIDAFDPASADRIRDARAGFEIRGPIVLEGQISIGDDATRYTFELTGSKNLTIGSAGNESTLTPMQGAVIVESERIRIEDLTFEIRTPNSPMPGSVSLTGIIPHGDSDGELSLGTTDLPIGSSFVAAALRRFAPKRSSLFENARPQGRVDASLSLRRVAGKWQITDGSVRPHSLSFDRSGARIAMEIESGEITIGPEGGAIHDWRAKTKHWSINADGQWFAGDTPGVDVQFNMDGDQLNDDLIAMLPAEVALFMRRFDLGVDRNFSLRNATFSFNAPSDGADLGAGFRDGVRFEGDIRFEGARINAGVSFTNADGEIHLLINRPPQVDSVSIDADIHMDRLRAANLMINNVTASVHSSNRNLRSLDIDLSGESHGGQIWAKGVIENLNSASQLPGHYEFDVRVAGVDLALAMQDFTTDGASQESPPVKRRGYVDGSMVFVGELSTSSPVQGAGDIRILGGELARLPLVMKIFEIGNLIPSSSEALDYARASFTMKGDTVTFDRIIAVSETLSMIGQGTVTTPDMALDLRFSTSGNRRLPVLSSLFDALRNELLTTRVRGTLTNPRFSTVQLSTTRRWLSRLLGLDNDRRPPQQATEPLGKPD